MNDSRQQLGQVGSLWVSLEGMRVVQPPNRYFHHFEIVSVPASNATS
jgi:hypothetical protein